MSRISYQVESIYQHCISTNDANALVLCSSHERCAQMVESLSTAGFVFDPRNPMNGKIGNVFEGWSRVAVRINNVVPEDSAGFRPTSTFES